MSIIPKERWINYYKNLCYDPSIKEKLEDKERMGVDIIEMTEL